MENKHLFTYANMFTFIRLVVSPLTLPFLIYFFLPYNIFALNIFLAIIFLLFALTDFFDGYCARKFNQVTSFGALLDPIADKFLLNAALITLVAVHKLFFFWAIILIAREFFVTGLRLIALQESIRLPASTLAKVKTTVQMIYIAWVIANPVQQSATWLSSWNLYEHLLLFLTLGLSLISAYWYFHAWLQVVRMRSNNIPPSAGATCPL